MPITQTHNVLAFQPPPGMRATIYGSDLHIDFERGREREVYTWLATVILPRAAKLADDAEEGERVAEEIAKHERASSERKRLDELAKLVGMVSEPPPTPEAAKERDERLPGIGAHLLAMIDSNPEVAAHLQAANPEALNELRQLVGGLTPSVVIPIADSEVD